ncbi:hypothetical protein QOT17_003284 [Balamuthia mandrillaris]
MCSFCSGLLTSSKAEHPHEQAPPGFKWKACKDLNGHILCPESWHFTESTNSQFVVAEAGPEGDAASFSSTPEPNFINYFLTKEDLQETGRFKTGLTLRLYPNLPRSVGLSPEQFARDCIARVEASVRRTILLKWHVSLQRERELGIKYKEVGYNVHGAAEKLDNDAVVVNTCFLFASEPREQLVEMVFESPEEEWEDAWRNYGATLTSSLRFGNLKRTKLSS